MTDILIWLKHRFELAFPKGTDRLKAYVIASLLLVALLLACCGCAGTATKAKEHVGSATIVGAAAGIAAAFGSLWAAGVTFVVALWSSVIGSSDEPDPWQLTLGVRALTLTAVVVVLLVVIANRLEWFPDWVRQRKEKSEGAGWS